MLLQVWDWARAQWKEHELRDGHRAVVEAFRSLRPTDTHNRRKYDPTDTGEPMVVYVCMEAGHHIANAMQGGELPTIDWVCDTPQDKLVLSAAQTLGVAKLIALGHRADEQQDYWLAARIWAIIGEVVRLDSGGGPSLEYVLNSMDAIALIIEAPDPDARDDLLLQMALKAISVFQADAIHKQLSVIKGVLETDAAARDPASMATIRIMLNMLLPQLPSWAGDVAPICENFLALMLQLKQLGSSNPDPLERVQCALLSTSFPMYELAALTAGFHADMWDQVFGQCAEDLIRSVRLYNYDAHHAFVMSMFNADWRCAVPSAQFLMYRWGDMNVIEEMVDSDITALRRSLGEPDKGVEQSCTLLGPSVYINTLHILGFAYLHNRVAPSLVDAGLTYTCVDETFEKCAIGWVRPRGDKTVNIYFNTVESFTWHAKCAHVLVSSNCGVSTTQVLGEMPSIADVIDFNTTHENCAMPHAICGHAFNLFYPLAAAAEKLGAFEKSLQYIDAGLSTDIERKAGTTLPITRALFSILRGRVLAALGRQAEAGATLEAAAVELRRLGLWASEVIALFHLQLCVLNKLGQSHSEHGFRRLGAALRRLKGPAEKLNQLIDGLDAAELMSLPPSDREYNIEYGGCTGRETDANAGLRSELQAMRFKQLRQRAKASGVDNELLEDAVDADDPKGALIAMLIDREVKQTAVAPASIFRLQAEDLVGLTLKDLRKRAREASIAEHRIEDAYDAEDIKATMIALVVEASEDRCSALEARGSAQQLTD